MKWEVSSSSFIWTPSRPRPPLINSDDFWKEEEDGKSKKSKMSFSIERGTTSWRESSLSGIRLGFMECGKARIGHGSGTMGRFSLKPALPFGFHSSEEGDLNSWERVWGWEREWKEGRRRSGDGEVKSGKGGESKEHDDAIGEEWALREWVIRESEPSDLDWKREEVIKGESSESRNGEPLSQFLKISNLGKFSNRLVKSWCVRGVGEVEDLDTREERDSLVKFFESEGPITERWVSTGDELGVGPWASEVKQFKTRPTKKLDDSKKKKWISESPS